MSKIVFVRPLRTLEQSYGELAAAGSTEPSQGVCSLAAVARQAGYETEIVDATMEGLSNERAAEEILSRKPKYVGLSALTTTIHDAAAIARLIKDRSNQKPVFSEKTGFSAGEVITIVGGVHVTAVPEETMRLFPHFDLGVLGEGEETILELLACLESYATNQKPVFSEKTGFLAALRAVKGLILRDGDRLVRTEPRPFIRDLDTLPFPAWDLLKGYPECSRPPAWCPNVGASGLVITSRGCTGKCTFCDRLCFGTTCRAHSADYVLDLIRYLKERFGVGYVRFLDDNFLLFPKRLEAICEGLLKPEMKLIWSCFGRVDTVDARRLRLMREAGCHEIAYGIESGSQRILDLICKEITLDQIREAVRLTHDAGIEVVGFFMIGHPTETRESILETIRFARELDLDYFKALYVTPFPGSELYQTADQYGAFNRDWRGLSTYHAPFVPHGLTRDELIAYRKLMFRKFYLHPRMIARHLRKCLNVHRAMSFVRGATALARFWLRKRAT